MWWRERLIAFAFVVLIWTGFAGLLFALDRLVH